MKLSEMKEQLAAGGIRLTKSLGQTFLHDGNQLRRIIEAAQLRPGDRVLEVGPGLGPLTELLLREAAEVFAIEKDQRLVEFLEKRFGPATNLTLLQADALKYLQSESRDWSGWKLVANLPYSVASPILIELAQARSCPERLVATLQIEVAQRLTAIPGSNDSGILSLLIQLRYQPTGWFKIPATCFFPQPDIDSACVTLLRRPEPLLTREQAETFTKLVKRSFSQRRKMMLKLLKEDWPLEILLETFERLQLSRQVRAEAVTLDQFVQLTKMLDRPQPPAKPQA